MKTLLAPMMAFAAIAAVALLPAPAGAQSYEDIISQQYQNSQNPRGNKKPDAEQAAESIYGEARVDEGASYEEGSTTDPQDEESNLSYDQMAIGTDGPQDLYSYIAGQEDRRDPVAKRAKNSAKAHEEALRQRASVIKKMQQNSADQIRKQKERAWKLSHPGQEYPGEQNEEDGESGYSDEGGEDSADEAGYSDEGAGQDSDSGGEGGY
jgi:hypothetical protein